MEKYRLEFNSGYAFIFTPETGRVECNSSHWIARAETLKHLFANGWEIDYNNPLNSFSSSSGKTVYVKVPELPEDELKEKIQQTVLNAEELHKIEEQKKKQEVLSKNFNKRENKPLSWESINVMLSTIKKENKYDRQYLCDYVNSFNFEDREGGEKFPLMRVTTTPKNTMIQSARKGLKGLFDKGALVRYTEEEVKAKLDKYNKKEEDK